MPPRSCARSGRASSCRCTTARAAVNFLDPPDAFLDALGARVERLETSELDVDEWIAEPGATTTVLPATPLR